MSQNAYGVRRTRGAAGQFEVADVSFTTADRRARELSQLSKGTAYSVVDVDTDEVHSTYLNGKEIS